MKTRILKKQADKTTSIAAISTMTGRSGSISPERLKVEQYLEAARRPHTNQEISDATGIGVTSVRGFTAKLMHDGRLRNMAKHVNLTALYIMADKVPKSDNAARGRFVSTQPLNWTPPTSARTEGTYHEDIPSRRGDTLVKQMPMLLMASKVRGGESAR